MNLFDLPNGAGISEAEDGFDELGGAFDAAIKGLEDRSVFLVGEKSGVCHAHRDGTRWLSGKGGGGKEGCCQE